MDAMTDKEAPMCMQATASNSGFAQPPDATIPGHVLRTAIAQAEHAASDLDLRIKDEAGQRDDLVRRAGVMQDHIDRMKAEHSLLTRHVRNLHAALT
jgi:hypothetical protein